MKNRKFKIASFAFALCFAVISTLAFSPVDNAEEDITIVQGFKWNPDQEHCQASILCQTDVTDFVCTSGGDTLYKLEGTSCPNQLYKRTQ